MPKGNRALDVVRHFWGSRELWGESLSLGREPAVSILDRHLRHRGDSIPEYDAFDRRIRRTVAGRTLRTVWDGWRAIEEIEEQPSGDVLISRRTFGLGLDDVLHLEQRADATAPLVAFTPIYDTIGNLVALVDETGRVVERSVYTTFGEGRTLVDDIPPRVEQVRLEDGSIVVEISEATRGALTGILVENLTTGHAVGHTAARPIVAGRRAQHRIVITPSESIEAGHELQLRLPASLLRDRFDNEASGEHLSTPFAWSSAGMTVVEDVEPPTIDAICVVEGKVRIAVSEPLDPTSLGDWTLDGTSHWTSIADGYGWESTGALSTGTFNLNLGDTAQDLAGQLIAIPASEAQHAFQLSSTKRSVELYQAPFAGESTTIASSSGSDSSKSSARTTRPASRPRRRGSPSNVSSASTSPERSVKASWSSPSFIGIIIARDGS